MKKFTSSLQLDFLYEFILYYIHLAAKMDASFQRAHEIQEKVP